MRFIMQIKRLQQFKSLATGKVVRVTTVAESRTFCVIKDVDTKNGKLVPHTGRTVQVDSLRRKYKAIA